MREVLLRRSICSACRASLSGSRLSNRRSYSILGKSEARKGSDLAARWRLPDRPARTRFAPSPTGYLHLGSLRTALYNYLLARATNGQFLLRLEDTDQSRIVHDAEARLYQDLKWAGLSWDEGPDCGGPVGPYKQSERLPIYQEHADHLVKEGKAFRCFCSPEDMAAHQRKALESEGAFGLYPGTCLSIPAEESAERAAKGHTHTIRFKSPSTPSEAHDIIYGLYKKKAVEDHFIIMKSDGFPTYHFANVVDDHLMDITHVVRGAEWLISTPKHVDIYKAFGWEPPKFAHVGLLVDSNRQKLSKRNMDIGIDSYRDNHIIPSALLNFAALLGWNPGSSAPNKGVMLLDDMVKNFSLKFTKGDIVVNMGKLDFFQRKHSRLLLAAEPPDMAVINVCLVNPVLQRARDLESERRAQSTKGDPESQESNGEHLRHLGSLVPAMRGPDEESARNYIYRVLRISRDDATGADEIIDANKFLLWQPSIRQITDSYRELRDSVNGVLIDKKAVSSADVMTYFAQRLGQIDDEHWKSENLQAALSDTVKRVSYYEEGRQEPIVAGYKYLRWALLGLTSGPQMVPLIELLGRGETLGRLQTARSVAENVDSAADPRENS